MKPKVKKHRTKNFWVVWHGPLNMVGMPFHTWEEAMGWANQYSRKLAVEPTC